MSITSAVNETQCVINLQANVDISDAADLEQALLDALLSHKELRLDLAGVTDMDITAVQASVGCRTGKPERRHLIYGHWRCTRRNHLNDSRCRIRRLSGIGDGTACTTELNSCRLTKCP